MNQTATDHITNRLLKHSGVELNSTRNTRYFVGIYHILLSTIFPPPLMLNLTIGYGARIVPLSSPYVNRVLELDLLSPFLVGREHYITVLTVPFSVCSLVLLLGRSNFSRSSLVLLSGRYNVTRCSLVLLSGPYNFTRCYLVLVSGPYNVTNCSLLLS